jgi:TolC family type I secretion outer membrane protein
VFLLVVLVSTVEPFPARAAEMGHARLSLSEAVATALREHPLLRAAGHGVEAAQARVRIARAGLLPRVDFSEGYTRSDNPVYTFGTKLDQGRFGQDDFAIARLNHPDPTSNFQTRLSLTQSLFAGGQTLRGVERARLGVEAAGAGRARAAQEVAFGAARAYHGVQDAQERLTVAEAAIRTAQANRDLIRDRHQAGLVVEADLLAAEVRLAALEQDAIAARHHLEVARATLNDAMGVPLETAFDLADPLAERPPRHPPEGQLDRLALDRRPDFRETALQEDAARKAVQAARGAFLPALDLRAGYELNHFNPTANGQDNWSVGVVLSLNLFQGGADRARLLEAVAEVERVRALRARQASAIKLEVQRAAREVRTGREQVAVAARAVGQAEERLRITRDRYEGGLTTVVDLLAAESALAEARGNRAQALVRYNVSLAALELALGTIDAGAF